MATLPAPATSATASDHRHSPAAPAQHRETTKDVLEDEWFSSIAACFHDMRPHWAKPGTGSKQDLQRFFESVSCLMSNQIRSTVYSSVTELASFFERYTVPADGQGPITGTEATANDDEAHSGTLDSVLPTPCALGGASVESDSPPCYSE